MADDNDDNADDGNFEDTLGKILGASSRVTTSLDLDLAFGATDYCRPRLHSAPQPPLPPSPPPIVSPPPFAAAGELI